MGSRTIHGEGEQPRRYGQAESALAVLRLSMSLYSDWRLDWQVGGLAGLEFAAESQTEVTINAHPMILMVTCAKMEAQVDPLRQRRHPKKNPPA